MADVSKVVEVLRELLDTKSWVSTSCHDGTQWKNCDWRNIMADELNLMALLLELQKAVLG